MDCVGEFKSFEFYRISHHKSEGAGNCPAGENKAPGMKPFRIFYVSWIFPFLARPVMKATGKIQQPRALRRRLGLNQQQFWSAVGVTQSGGSRYESGRDMPHAVSELLRLVHIEGIDLARVRGEHFVIANHLRNTNPALYRRIKHQVRAKASHGAR